MPPLSCLANARPRPQLFNKIIRADYMPVDRTYYSERLSNLVDHLLVPDPRMRPKIDMVRRLSNLVLGAGAIVRHAENRHQRMDFLEGVCPCSFFFFFGALPAPVLLVQPKCARCFVARGKACGMLPS